MPVQYLQPYQKPIGLFFDYETAENALNELLKAGFSAEHLSLIPQSLDPNRPVTDTEAAKSAKVGAIAGSFFGGVLGLTIGYISLNLFDFSHIHPLSHIIGLGLAGSALGAAYVALISALAGANVHKIQGKSQQDESAGASSDDSQNGETYLILAEGTATQLSQAQAILRQNGAHDVSR